MVVQVVILDPTKLHAIINSLRPPQKSDEVPKEVYCVVHNQVPVLDSAANVGIDLAVRPLMDVTLRLELTQPFTGMVFLAMSTERTRLSIALFPADVKDLAIGQVSKFSFFPAPLLKFLVAVKSSKITLALELDKLVVTVQVEGSSGNVTRTMQASLPYVADGESEDGRSLFKDIPLQRGVRITGEEMTTNLKMMDPNLLTIALHSSTINGAEKQAFTVSCSGDMQYMITYVVPGPPQPVVDVREAAVSKNPAVKEAATVDEDLEALKKQCEAPAAAARDEDLGERLMINAREYLRRNLAKSDAKRVRFDLGAHDLRRDTGETYKLHSHGLVQSKQLMGLLSDHSRNLEHGLTILLGHQDRTSFIVLAMPWSAQGLLLHAVACSIAEEE